MQSQVILLLLNKEIIRMCMKAKKANETKGKTKKPSKITPEEIVK